jgi:hypothetical protein
MSRTTFALSVLALVSLAACAPPSFEAATTAPPGAVAEYGENLAEDDRWIRVTQGVAFAVACKDKHGDPCSYDGTFVENTSVADVYRGYSDLLEPDHYYRGETKQARSLFVVVGRSVGTTQLRVRTGKGDYAIRVDVLPRATF